MRATRSAAIAAIVIGLIGTWPAVVTAQDATTATEQGVLVTGEIVPGTAIDFTEQAEADGVMRERNR